MNLEIGIRGPQKFYTRRDIEAVWAGIQRYRPGAHREGIPSVEVFSGIQRTITSRPQKHIE